jgi:hypothetical protein
LPTTCTANETQPCPIVVNGVGYYGRQQCQADGGFGACVDQSSTCSLMIGSCAGARRLFVDLQTSCGAASYFALDAGYAPIETCPGDDRDNDCDGYVDETVPSGAELCGQGLCAETVNGRLPVYKRCGEFQCSEQRLSADLPGYEPVDRCDDGVDRDCSGVVGAGPGRVLQDQATGISLIGDEFRGADRARWRAIVTTPDGGANYFLISEQLVPTIPSTLPVAASASFPMIAQIDQQTSLMAWLEGDGGVGVGRSLLSGIAGVTQPRPTFAPPIRAVGAPRVAPVSASHAWLTVPIAVDGGTAYLIKLVETQRPSVVSWGPRDTFDPALTPLVKVSGDGAPRATITAVFFNNSSGSGLLSHPDGNDVGRNYDDSPWDGGAFPLGAAPYAVLPSPPFPPLTLRLVNGTTVPATAEVAHSRVDDLRVVSQFVARTLYFISYRDTDPIIAAACLAPRQPCPEVPGELRVGESAVAGISLDGGIFALIAARREDDRLVVAPLGDGGLVDDAGTVALGTTVLATVSSPASIAWSSEYPRYALVAAVEATPDGGKAAIGRLVCAPPNPIR